MNTVYIRSLFFTLTISGILFSCSSTNYLTMNATQPAPVFIPASLQKIGVIDRSLPVDKNKSLDDIDKLLTAEGKNLDKDGAHSAVLGLYDELIHNNRFSEITLIENANLKSPGLGVFPAAIPWEKVEEICKDNNVDVLFVLCFFDTDTKVFYNAKAVQIANPFGLTIPAIEHEATMTTYIKTGWRIYDPKDKYILDEFVYNDNVVQFGRGINPMIALKQIANRKEAVQQTSNNIGHAYATRVLPYTIRVSRDYYVRGSNNFVIAKRRAQTGNWDSAAELWFKEVSNPNMKVAGRACYNMAIINEINGDLPKAIEWASKAYTDYNNKLALQYIKILKNRMAKNKQVDYENKN